MPYHEDPYGSGKYRYFDPLKKIEWTGLMGVVDPILQWMHSNREWQTRWDVFAEFPVLEKIDYDRLIYEAIYPVRVYDDRYNERAYCCWPYPCVMCAAIGCTVHFHWRQYFDRHQPYWRKETSVV